MRACLALCMAVALIGAALAECGACINGNCYKKHILPINGVSGYLLGIHRATNTLYIKENDKIRRCQIDTGVCNDTGISGFIISFTVDQRTGDTYARINDDTGYSLYKLDLVNNEKKLLVRNNVWFIVFKDKLYYSTWYNNDTYTFEDGESRKVPGSDVHKILIFAVDKNNDIYFTASDSYNILRRLSKGIVSQTDAKEDDYVITVDNDGTAIVINFYTNVVYTVTDGHQVEVGAIKDKFTIYHYFLDIPLFDKDNNIIYKTVKKDIVHLKKENDVKCTTSVSDNDRIITEIVL